MTYAYARGKLTDDTENTGSVEQPYRFVGQLGYYSHWQDGNLFDEEDWQLLQLGVRFYDPEVGRFTQVDAVPLDSGFYAYAENAPSTHVDPHGLQADDAGDAITQCELNYKGCIEAARLERGACEWECSWRMGIAGGASVGVGIGAGACKAAAIISGPVLVGAIVVIGGADYIAYRVCMNACRRLYDERADSCRMARAACICRAKGIPVQRCDEFAPWR